MPKIDRLLIGTPSGRHDPAVPISQLRVPPVNEQPSLIFACHQVPRDWNARLREVGKLDLSSIERHKCDLVLIEFALQLGKVQK